jgi:uncharacterized protein
MKKFSWILFFSFAYALCFAQTVDEVINKPPSPQRLVNDFAGAMTQDQINTLERKLVAYDDSTSIQIAIVTFKTIGNYSIDDVALRILRNWGVGNKKTNNGIVIVAAIDDHKVFIATGGGMEQSVPDITAKEIIENEIVPNFRENNQDNYYRGFDHATDAIIKAAAGQYTAPEGYHKRGRGSSGGSILGVIIFVIIILVLISRGGGGGRGRGGMMNRTGFFPWVIASMLSDRGGGGWSGGGGGGWSGGGGGGFGGFGGGGGGGGGAGGSW